MLERYTAWDIAAGWQEYDLTLKEGWTPEPHYNAAPGLLLPVALPGRIVQPAEWGLRAAGGKKPLLHAAAELLTTTQWHERFRTRRCLVLADGFYEWDAERQPWRFQLEDGADFCFAGVYDSDRIGKLRFAVITRQAAETSPPVASRLPLVLLPEAAAAWLDAAEPGLPEPPPPGLLQCKRVNKAMGSYRSEYVQLVKAATEEAAPAEAEDGAEPA
jgi:putative SOS response-associated peptidase YedK